MTEHPSSVRHASNAATDLDRRLVIAPVVDIATRMRGAGLAVSTGEVLDAMRALAAVDVSSRSQVRAALHACLVKSPGSERTVDRIIDVVLPRIRAYADPGSADPPASLPGESVPDALADALARGDDDALSELLDSAVAAYSGAEAGRSLEHHTARTLRRLDLATIYRRYLERAHADGTDFDRALDAADADAAIERLQREVEDLVAARLRDRLATAEPPAPASMDLQDRAILGATPDELSRLRAAIRPLARQLASRLSSRRRRARGTLDMRRTLRASMGTGGVPVSPQLRRRRRTRPDLVVLCDVSGSTAEFAPFTLALLHAVHQEFHRVRSFAFVDGIVEITDVLQSSPGVLDPRLLLDRRGLIAADGRSDYLGVLTRFLLTWGDAVSPRTTVLIAGDARSHHNPPAIGPMKELAHRARRLHWLNPEPRHEWDTRDSRMSFYAMHCDGVHEVSTLRQLADAVAEIA